MWLSICKREKILPCIEETLWKRIFFGVIHPLLLKYVYKEKWQFFTSDNYRLFKYVLIPCIIFEVAVIMYYPKESIMAAKQVGAEESVDK